MFFVCLKMCILWFWDAMPSHVYQLKLTNCIAQIFYMVADLFPSLSSTDEVYYNITGNICFPLQFSQFFYNMHNIHWDHIMRCRKLFSDEFKLLNQYHVLLSLKMLFWQSVSSDVRIASFYFIITCLPFYILMF